MKQILLIIFAVLTLLITPICSAESLNVAVEVPLIDANPYHKPYVAVWIETPKRQGVHTLAFWKEQSDWYKDLRQWWRKIGRKKSPNYDAVSGATRKPGVYKLSWDGNLESGKQVLAGEYVLHIEAVREQGSREYLRQRISLGQNQVQQFELQGQTELGKILISIK